MGSVLLEGRKVAAGALKIGPTQWEALLSEVAVIECRSKTNRNGVSLIPGAAPEGPVGYAPPNGKVSYNQRWRQKLVPPKCRQ